VISASALLNAEGMRRWATGESTLPERLLIALRWHDWVTSGDLFDGMDLADDDRKDASSHLSRMVKRGQVEADRSSWPALYRLPPARMPRRET
jgi:hypothetical protein